MNLFKIADDQLEEFLSENVKKYEKNRNYDWGPENRTNVSNLSHFISHRAVLEYDAVLRTLDRQGYKAAEKFIQEIFWRVYWKGWLEMRPTVATTAFNLAGKELIDVVHNPTDGAVF